MDKSNPTELPHRPHPLRTVIHCTKISYPLLTILSLLFKVKAMVIVLFFFFCIFPFPVSVCMPCSSSLQGNMGSSAPPASSSESKSQRKSSVKRAREYCPAIADSSSTSKFGYSCIIYCKFACMRTVYVCITYLKMSEIQ